MKAAPKKVMPHVSRVLIDTVLNSLPVGLMVLGPQGGVAAANPALYAILGLDRAEVEGRNWAEIFLDDPLNDALTPGPARRHPGRPNQPQAACPLPDSGR